ncbi:MAG TPA: MMPL family transporter [bacterium]|nr:MMPL family transporter [bacterium]
MRKRVFRCISRFILRHPKKIVAVAVILAAAGVTYAATSIKLNANLDELVSEKLEYHRNYLEFLREFGDEEYLYVVADAGDDLPRAKLFMESLGGKLAGNQELEQVIWKIDNPALERGFLLYLSPAELSTLESMLTGGPFAVKGIASWDGFAPMFGALATRIAGPVSPSDETELATGFAFIDGLIDDMAAAVERGAPYASRLQALFFGGDESFDTDGFLKNGPLLMMLIMPKKDYGTAAVIEKPLRDIRAAIEETKREFPGLDAGLTGRPVLSADEMETSNRDMTLATLLAVLFVSAIFIVTFRGVARPMCAVAALVMGVSWTFGFLALAIGTLNILTSVFALILIAASIEYSIYIVGRYEEELAKGGSVAGAVERTLTTTAMAQLTSAVTTSAAFLTLMWTDFLAIAELGLVSAAGIMLCLASMTIVLPAMLVIRDRRLKPAALKKVKSFDLPWLAKLYRRPSLVLAGAVIAIAAVAPFALRISFDNNLLNLQARGLESVKYEHMLIDKSGETTWFARAVTETAAESHELAERLRALPSVRGVDDVERIVPQGQKEKIEAVRRMAPAFEGVKWTDVSERVNAKRLMFELGRLAANLDRLQAAAFSAGRAEEVEEMEAFAGKIRGLVRMIDEADAEALSRLGRLQKEFFEDIQKNLGILAGGMDPVEIALEDLPRDVSGRFVSPEGRYSMMIYPKENIWDPDALARFVNELRSVDARVIGTPIEVHESGNLMRKTFARSAVAAFLLICVLVWLDFRSLRAAAVAVGTLSGGLLLLFGWMGIFGIQFNMANFFAIPILIGTGIDFGVQVTHRLRQEASFEAMGTSTGRSLLATAAANGLGFGMMMIAHHRGVASLGQILALGCLCCLASALFLAPPLAGRLSWGRRKEAADI